MMRRLQPVDASSLPVTEPGALTGDIDIASEQQTLAARLDQQYTGALIGVARTLPLPDGKTDAIPLPALTADTRLSPQGRRQLGGFATEYLPHRQAALDRRGAACMVSISVAEQHQINRPDPQLVQGRQYHAFTQVVIAHCRPGVVQQHVFTGTQHKRQALTNIQLPDFQLTMRHSLPGRKRRQQQQGPAHNTHRQSRRQQHQQRAQGQQ
ncbi:hypothetical protein D3C77_350300 [compost metagenome]